MKSAKKRETWPDGYSEPDWLWRLEKDWPRPSKMVHIAFYGMAIAFAASNLISIKGEVSWALCFGCLLYGLFFSGNKNPSDLSLSERPEVMLHRWLQQKARADAWAGAPWTEERKQTLRECVEWEENDIKNHADDGKKRRASDNLNFRSMLLESINQIENIQRWRDRDQ